MIRIEKEIQEDYIPDRLGKARKKRLLIADILRTHGFVSLEHGSIQNIETHRINRSESYRTYRPDIRREMKKSEENESLAGLLSSGHSATCSS